MEDAEILSIAEQTAKILKESKCGMDDVVAVIRMLALRVKEVGLQNAIFKKALREKRERLNTAKWEEITLGLQKRIKELETVKYSFEEATAEMINNGAVTYSTNYPNFLYKFSGEYVGGWAKLLVRARDEEEWDEIDTIEQSDIKADWCIYEVQP